MRYKNVKSLCMLTIGMILVLNLTAQFGSAHSPKFIDLKFYLDDQVLSIYYVHGVSDTTLHYINNTEIEFYNLSSSFFTYIDELIANETIDGYDKIVEYLKKHSKKGDLIITQGATDIFKIGERFLGGKS